jgi:pSer/pThr/pTyr-binding forkhead associated (FHA) protein/DNA-binding CsgD family transcriptional regulator
MSVNTGTSDVPASLKWSGGLHPLAGPCFIGRRSDNDIPISNVQASRRHAVLMNLNDDWWINDLGSRNGINVNGLRLSSARRLRNGDEIRIANQRLVFYNSGQSTPHHSSIMGKTTELTPQTLSDAPSSSVFCELLIVTEKGEILEGDKAAHWFFGKRLERAPGTAHYFLPPAIRQWLQQLADENEKTSPPLELEQEGHRILLSLARCKDDRFYLLVRVDSAHISIERLQTLGLTLREAEVMHWVCEGKNNPEIAQILDVTLHTVNRHNEHIFKKLAVDNRHKAIKTVKERLGGV